MLANQCIESCRCRQANVLYRCSKHRLTWSGLETREIKWPLFRVRRKNKDFQRRVAEQPQDYIFLASLFCFDLLRLTFSFVRFGEIFSDSPFRSTTPRASATRIGYGEPLHIWVDSNQTHFEWLFMVLLLISKMGIWSRFSTIESLVIRARHNDVWD